MTDDVIKQRLADLTKGLAAATTARAAQWQLEDQDVFRWTAAEGGVTVGSRDHDGEPPYELVVYNPGRERVDELTSALLADDQPAPWNDALAELYRAARRSALRADDIIDALIESLRSGADNEPQREHSFLRGRTAASAGTSDT
jgi:ankyrin repeat protein